MAIISYDPFALSNPANNTFTRDVIYNFSDSTRSIYLKSLE